MEHFKKSESYGKCEVLIHRGLFFMGSSQYPIRFKLTDAFSLSGVIGMLTTVEEQGKLLPSLMNKPPHPCSLQWHCHSTSQTKMKFGRTRNGSVDSVIRQILSSRSMKSSLLLRVLPCQPLILSHPNASNYPNRLGIEEIPTCMEMDDVVKESNCKLSKGLVRI